MKCAQASALLGEYLESDLDLPARTQIDKHLAHCADCKRELQDLRSTVALLRSLPTPEPPENLHVEVMERIDAGETRIAHLPERFRRVFDPRVAAPLAAGIAGLVLFATMSDGLGTPAQKTMAVASVQAQTAGARSASIHSENIGTAVASATTERFERRMWDDKPTTLSGRALAVKQASAARNFRVAPRLTSTESNIAIRLARPKNQTGVGFYGRTDPDPQFLNLDAHLDRAKAQPEAFLRVVSGTDEVDRGTFIAPFAVRAARRGDAQAVAGRLRRASHPQARSAAEQFEQSWQRTRRQPAQATYSR